MCGQLQGGDVVDKTTTTATTTVTTTATRKKTTTTMTTCRVMGVSEDADLGGGGGGGGRIGALIGTMMNTNDERRHPPPRHRWQLRHNDRAAAGPSSFTSIPSSLSSFDVRHRDDFVASCGGLDRCENVDDVSIDGHDNGDTGDSDWRGRGAHRRVRSNGW